MARALFITVAFGLFVLAVLPSQPANAQAVLCYGQTFDSKVEVNGEDEFFWTAITSCPVIVREIGFLAGLYHYHWDDGLWYPVRFVGGSGGLHELGSGERPDQR